MGEIMTETGELKGQLEGLSARIVDMRRYL